MVVVCQVWSLTKWLPIVSPRSRTLEDTRGDRDVERLMMKSSAEEFRAKTDGTLLLSREVGNMYTASLYSGVASLLAT